MSQSSKCGFCGLYPKWLQNWATSRSFIVVYGFLGTVQAMAFIYMVVSLSTLEKRFKIPSRTTGLMLSGNEISQILSILLIYYGGSGHRPRWIAMGVGCSAISCMVLALPHAIYGPGQDALALTKEYMNTTLLFTTSKNELPICSKNSRPETCNDEDLSDNSVVPSLLVFFSQFILGIGTTLYYGLGQTYMDDNTKKKNTPMLLGLTFSMRMIGPAFGFILGYLCLNIYIDPSIQPIIDKKDPRWMGAWWLGWIILGITMSIFAILLGMFPHELRKSKKKSQRSNALSESEVPLKIETHESEKIEKSEKDEKTVIPTATEKPTLKDFPKAIKRILKNKLLMSNTFSAVFYVLSSSSLINYISKYFEIQFQTSPGGGTVITGPVSLLAMVLGFLISGFVISKFKPSPRPLLFWNVIVGFCYFLGTISFVFLGCDNGSIQGIDFETKQMNLTSACNIACNCEHVKYSPVCHEATHTTFFSACHAGCTSIINDTTFGHCSCIAELDSGGKLRDHNLIGASLRLIDDTLKASRFDEHIADRVTAGPCKQDCLMPMIIFGAVYTFVNILGCSARIGNVLLNYRCVETRDKSLAQGITLWLVSLFALIPGPIIFGAIMDSTCIVWDISCQKKGNCWFYHRDHFRYNVHVTSAVLCLIGVILDVVVCYLSKGIDLYGDNDEDEKRKVSPLKTAEMTLNNELNPKQST